MVMDVSGNEGVEEKMVNIYFYFCSLKEIYTSSLNFEDFGENLDYSKFLYIGTFVLLLLFFFSSISSSSLFFFERSTQVSFGNIDGGSNRNVGAYNKRG
jgi:hypothetical protein